MDARLLRSLDSLSLLSIAGLAAGYAAAPAGTSSAVELAALAEHDDPVVLLTQMTYRVGVVADLTTGGRTERLELSAHMLRGAPLSPQCRAHALSVLHVTSGADLFLSGSILDSDDLADRFLDAQAAAGAGYWWMDLADGACAALRASIAAITRAPLRHESTSRLLARAASLELVA